VRGQESDAKTGNSLNGLATCRDSAPEYGLMSNSNRDRTATKAAAAPRRCTTCATCTTDTYGGASTTRTGSRRACLLRRGSGRPGGHGDPGARSRRCHLRREDTAAVVHTSAVQLVYVARNALEHVDETITVHGAASLERSKYLQGFPHPSGKPDTSGFPVRSEDRHRQHDVTLIRSPLGVGQVDRDPLAGVRAVAQTLP